MHNEIDREPELKLLGEVSRELAQRGLKVQIRDALPALGVETAFPGVLLYVFVAASGHSYVWQHAKQTHRVQDPAGAADKIATYVTEWNTAQNGGERS